MSSRKWGLCYFLAVENKSERKEVESRRRWWRGSAGTWAGSCEHSAGGGVSKVACEHGGNHFYHDPHVNVMITIIADLHNTKLRRLKETKTKSNDS